MLKYNNEVRKVIESRFENDNKRDNVFNLIDNNFLIQILTLENQSFSTHLKLLTRKFKPEELIKYREVILKNEVFSNETIIFDKEHIILMMRKFGLNSQERRDEYINKSNELFKLLLEMCNGSKESYFEFCKKYEEYVFLRKEGENFKLKKFIPLGLILRLVGEKENYLEADITLRKKIKFLRSYEANDIVTKIKYEVADILAIKSRRKTKDILDNVKVLIEDNNNDDYEKEDNIREIETLESIKLERDQYKSSLLLIQRTFDELREKIQEETDNVVNEQIKEFFISLNSGKYGNFLDKIPLTEELLKDIRKNNVEIPQEVKRVLMFIKSIIKFIKDTGIVPIREMGSTFKGTAEDIAEMDYTGNEFEEGEIKELKVVAPGYKYKDIIISIPKVKEIEK